MSLSSTNNLYSFPQPYTRVFPAPIIAQRAPTTSDISFRPGQIWVDQANQNTYELIAVSGGLAKWVSIGGNNGYPITPYVVGPSGGYSTIQAAVTAAGDAGGGLVWVQPGSYTENLALRTNVVIASANPNICTISGTHTPPVTAPFTGYFGFLFVHLFSLTSIFSTNSSGSAHLTIDGCTINCENGFTYDLPNWSGILEISNSGSNGTSDGFVNNSGGSQVNIFNSDVGAGTANVMLTSGTVNIDSSRIFCFWNAATGTSMTIDSSAFNNRVTFSNNSTGKFQGCRFTSGSNAAIVMSSSGTIYITNCVIDAINAGNAIDGAGVGALNLGNIVFLHNETISNTLTIFYNTDVSGPITCNGDLTIPTSSPTSGLVLPVATASGATPQFINARVGSVTFTGISIPAATATTLVITNPQIDGVSTRILLTMSGSTVGSALSINTIVPSIGSVSITVTNGTGATTSTSNIIFDFILLN